jgi:hypothetical protein
VNLALGTQYNTPQKEQAFFKEVRWIRNTDLDLHDGKFGDEYFARLNSVYARLMFPTAEVFAPDGALDNFLQLSMTSGLKSPRKSSVPRAR